MRIVADPNTVVSGLLWAGTPRRLLDAGRHRHVTLVTSLALLAELAEVLGRDKFAARIRAAKLSAKGLVEDYAAIAEVIEPAALAQVGLARSRRRPGAGLRARRESRRYRLRRQRPPHARPPSRHPDPDRQPGARRDQAGVAPAE